MKDAGPPIVRIPFALENRTLGHGLPMTLRAMELRQRVCNVIALVMREIQRRALMAIYVRHKWLGMGRSALKQNTLCIG